MIFFFLPYIQSFNDVHMLFDKLSRLSFIEKEEPSHASLHQLLNLKPKCLNFSLLLSVLLAQKKFIYHYKNMRWAKGRHETYLCFVIKRRVGPDSLAFDFGHLRNRSGCHVEVREEQ